MATNAPKAKTHKNQTLPLENHFWDPDQPSAQLIRKVNLQKNITQVNLFSPNHLIFQATLKNKPSITLKQRQD